jgi:hypothetical protein
MVCYFLFNNGYIILVNSLNTDSMFLLFVCKTFSSVLMRAFCYKTGCRSLVVVLSLSNREVVSSSPARSGRVKPKAYEIGSDCSFAKSTAVRSENHGSFGYAVKNGGPVSQ